MAALAGPIVGSCLPCLGFQAQQAHGSLRRQRTASATRSGLFQVSTVAEVLPHGGCPCAHRGDCGTSADGNETLERQARGHRSHDSDGHKQLHAGRRCGSFKAGAKQTIGRRLAEPFHKRQNRTRGICRRCLRTAANNG